MNATHVCSGRLRHGFTLISIALFLLAARQMKGAQIVITVTGDVMEGSGDLLHVFGKERNLVGKPYTLVFTFDDTKGRKTPLAGCQGSASGIQGDGVNSPGLAVLTISGKSFTFGTKKFSHSEVWRSIASACSPSQIAVEVDDDANRWGSVVNINLHPAGPRSLSQDPDWRSPLSTTAMEPYDRLSGFSILVPGMYGDGGIFSIKSVTITGPGWRTLWR